MTLRVPLIRWTHPNRASTRIHVLDRATHLVWTLCGLRVPPRTIRVYRTEEELELAREYDLCDRCRRVFGVPLRPTQPRRRRRRRDAGTRRHPAVIQLTL